jgi:hypothetical protein
MRDNSSSNRVLISRHPIPLWLLTFLCWMTATNLPVRVVVAESKNLPRVIMLEISGITMNDDTLYEAIRAQLSATSVQLDRLPVDDSQFALSNPLSSASKVATKYSAAMVFWITKKEMISTIYYYYKDASNPQIHTRELNLASESLLSRFDTIGNAVSTIVEETVSPRAVARTRPVPKPLPPPSPPRQNSDRSRKWINLFTFYAGSYFESRSVTHGLGFGLGLLPIQQLAITISYDQGFPLIWDTERYKLTLGSKNITSSIAGRVPMGFLELRVGLAWSVDIRSHSMTSSSESISPRPGGVRGIHSLVASLVAIWSLSDVIGIMTMLGVDLAFNEGEYKILRDDDSEVLLVDPFRAKLTYAVGLIVQL